MNFDPRQFLMRAAVGFVFVLVAAVPVWIFMISDRIPNRPQQMILYLSVCLIAGVVFTAASISTGQINWPRLGISLGGGAAIGVITLLVIDGLLPPVPTPAVIEPSSIGLVSCIESGSGVAVTRINDTNRYLVELQSGEYRPEDAKLVFRVIRSGTDKETLRYIVNREGRILREDE